MSLCLGLLVFDFVLFVVIKINERKDKDGHEDAHFSVRLENVYSPPPYTYR